MRVAGKRLFSVILSWALVIGVIAHVIRGLLRSPLPTDGVGAILGLLAAAAIAAGLAGQRPSRALPRLALTFLLTALVLFPAPVAALLALLTLVMGRGAGVAGLPDRSVHHGAAVALAVVAAAWIAGLPAQAPGDAGLQFGWLLLLLGIVQFGSLAGAIVLSGGAVPRPPMRRLFGLELANVPLAWLLAGMLQHEAWPQAVALSVLILTAQAALMRSSETEGELNSSRRALASRMKELRTLHAVGRAILESPEPARVCAVIDAECRKIFEVERCIVALADPRTGQLRGIYRRDRGMQPQTDAVALDDGLTLWLSQHSSGVRIDDLREQPGIVSVEQGMRSALVAPLVVENRLLGLVSIQTRKPGAYDDHQLSVLTTIAHQAAVAIESARHYQQATIDSLTGCFLRDYFFERLGEEHERSERYGGVFSLLMLDLDGFKAINDLHGHLAGDCYLREIGVTLLAQLRAADIACRYGGDEFTLLLPETDLEGAKVIAERIRLAIAVTVVTQQGANLCGTASIGIAVYPDHRAGDIHGLLRKADEALYRAKRAGRDCVIPFAA